MHAIFDDFSLRLGSISVREPAQGGVHYVRSLLDALHAIGDALARGGVVLFPPPSTCHDAVGTPQLLADPELAAIPALAYLARELPAELRLVVGLWSDKTAVLTAVPRNIGPPPQWWLDRAYSEARAARSDEIRE